MAQPPTSLQDVLQQLNYFLATAPSNWQPNENLRRFLLPNGEHVSCVLWNNLFHVSGTDIIRALSFRFEAIGRPVTNPKKFEEGVFSDLRALKPGQDACLEENRSEFLEWLYRHNCIRTQKKQKVFYWFSVPWDQLFVDALERDLKREALGIEPTSTPIPRIQPSQISNLTLSQPTIQMVQQAHLPPAPLVRSQTPQLEGTPQPQQHQFHQQQFLPHYTQLPTPQQSYPISRGATPVPSQILSINPHSQTQSPASSRGSTPQPGYFPPHISPKSSPMLRASSLPVFVDLESQQRQISNTPAITPLSINHPQGEQQLMGPPQPVQQSAQQHTGQSVPMDTFNMPSNSQSVETQYLSDPQMQFSNFEINQPTLLQPFSYSPETLPGSLTSTMPTESLQPPQLNNLTTLQDFLTVPQQTDQQMSQYPAEFRSQSLPPLSIQNHQYGALPHEQGYHSQMQPYTPLSQPIHQGEQHPQQQRESASEPPKNSSEDQTTDNSRRPKSSTLLKSFSRRLSLPREILEYYGAVSKSNPTSYSAGGMQNVQNNNGQIVNINGVPHLIPSTGLNMMGMNGLNGMPPGAGILNGPPPPLPSLASMLHNDKKDTGKIFVCQEPGCGRGFKRYEHLRRHARIHSGEKPFKCPVEKCGRSFSRSDNLNQHMKVHAGRGTNLSNATTKSQKSANGDTEANEQNSDSLSASSTSPTASSVPQLNQEQDTVKEELSPTSESNHVSNNEPSVSPSHQDSKMLNSHHHQSIQLLSRSPSPFPLTSAENTPRASPNPNINDTNTNTTSQADNVRNTILSTIDNLMPRED
ncbi:STE like transcription factor-domain-containing protein [Paraphysoderma sedebokerense]|nr:STE like transcription factor-domain-containing protein [Paraphysoderma sedebokerense]